MAKTDKSKSQESEKVKPSSPNDAPVTYYSVQLQQLDNKREPIGAPKTFIMPLMALIGKSVSPLQIRVPGSEDPVSLNDSMVSISHGNLFELIGCIARVTSELDSFRIRAALSDVLMDKQDTLPHFNEEEIEP